MEDRAARIAGALLAALTATPATAAELTAADRNAVHYGDPIRIRPGATLCRGADDLKEPTRERCRSQGAGIPARVVTVLSSAVGPALMVAIKDDPDWPTAVVRFVDAFR